jgi:hypothetical protein
MSNSPTALPLADNSQALRALAPTVQPNPAPAPKPTTAQRIIHGALAAATAAAGPEIDAQGNPQPRRGLAHLFGGILQGAMTALAAGANRKPGEAGGGLAAMGRGFEAVQQRQQDQSERARLQAHQNFEEQQQRENLKLEQARVAMAQNESYVKVRESEANLRLINQSIDKGDWEFAQQKLGAMQKDADLVNEMQAKGATAIPGVPTFHDPVAGMKWLADPANHKKVMDFANGKVTQFYRVAGTGDYALFEIGAQQETEHTITDRNGKKLTMFGTDFDASHIQSGENAARLEEKYRQVSIAHEEAEVAKIKQDTHNSAIEFSDRVKDIEAQGKLRDAQAAKQLSAEAMDKGRMALAILGNPNMNLSEEERGFYSNVLKGALKAAGMLNFNSAPANMDRVRSVVDVTEKARKNGVDDAGVAKIISQSGLNVDDRIRAYRAAGIMFSEDAQAAWKEEWYGIKNLLSGNGEAWSKPKPPTP